MISEIGRVLASSKSYVRFKNSAVIKQFVLTDWPSQIALTGPGVSTLSGFKDLRDPTHDLWKKYNYKIWDYKLFQRQPELLWRLVRTSGLLIILQRFQFFLLVA